ncbi:MAG TPA: hypothetical protein VHX60_05675 [Acidobacteriaceae bacterium]|jgi:hypothetical protein|nr:hypothetical protein [Acidobacteriaceae bacterium]
MEMFVETLSVVGALLLSISCGLLIEEMVFGGLVRLFFAPKPAASAKEGWRKPQERKDEGERTCLR